MNNSTTTTPPNGYKKTAIGVIPVEWEIKKLGEILVFKNGLNKEKEFFGTGTPIVNYKDVYKNNYLNATILEGKVTVNSNELKNFNVKKGDVFFTRTSETIKEIGLSSVVVEDVSETVFSGFILRGRPKNNDLDIIFCVYCFNSVNIRREIMTKSTCTTRALTNGTLLSDVSILVPPLPEQQKIAEILSTWDEAIANCKNTIKSLKARNKGLAQHLLTGKKRLSGFSEKWSVKPLSDLLIYTPREVDKPNKSFLALGLRSHGKGVFHKPDFDPNAIAMTKLFEVKENDLVVNITFAWEQAIAIASKEDEGGLVSHRFPTYVFNPKTATQLYFKFFVLQSFFKSKLELISPGGAGRNRVMSKKDFLKLEVKVPHLEEQIAIAQLLETADQELKSYQTKLEALQLQKKGLMQQLLTGKIRVKVK